jgi:hypothetical protein
MAAGVGLGLLVGLVGDGRRRAREHDSTRGRRNRDEPGRPQLRKPMLHFPCLLCPFDSGAALDLAARPKAYRSR